MVNLFLMLIQYDRYFYWRSELLKQHFKMAVVASGVVKRRGKKNLLEVFRKNYEMIPADEPEVLYSDSE